MLKTIGDKILVKRTEADTKTAGGLFIPESGQDKAAQGTVVAVGPGLPDGGGNWRDVSVRVGDVIIFHPHAGTEIKDGAETYLVMKEVEVLAIKATE